MPNFDRAFTYVILVSSCASFACAAESEGGDGDSDATNLIILVPAFHATTTNSWSFESVADVLSGEGHEVHLASLPPYASSPDRAEALVAEIETARQRTCIARHPDQDLESCVDSIRLHLVGHSQGGLDARFAVSKLDFGAPPISVTTMSTPHRGTPLGDAGINFLLDPRSNSPKVRAVGEFLDDLLGDDGLPDDLSDGFYWLSEQRFAEAVPGSEADIPDVDGVIYESWAGVATQDGSIPDEAMDACGSLEFLAKGRAADLRGVADLKTFTAVAPIFDDRHQPIDGHIPVASAKYGTFNGCVPTDHLDLIGRPNDQTDENAELTGFDYRAFYRELGQHLSEL